MYMIHILVNKKWGFITFLGTVWNNDCSLLLYSNGEVTEVIIVERQIVKSGLYTFVIVICLMFLLIPKTTESITSSGYPIVTHKKTFEYILLVIKNSVLITLAFTMLIYVKKKSIKQFNFPFILTILFYLVFGFVVVSGIGIFLVYLIRFILLL